MRYIVKTLMEQTIETAKLYTYLVRDDQGNQEEIQSLQKFEDGERAEVWFDSQWDKAKLKKKKGQ